MKYHYAKSPRQLDRSRPSPTILPGGVLVEGWLYKVRKEVSFRDIRQKYSALDAVTHSYGTESGGRDPVSEQAVIKDLFLELVSLKLTKVAATLWTYLVQPEAADEFDANSPPPTERLARLFDAHTARFFSSASFDLDTQKDMHMVAKRLVHHGSLRLGSLGDDDEPSAIFLCTETSHVFVSCGLDGDEGSYPLPGANFVHMLDVWQGGDDASLFVKGNMYGIWRAGRDARKSCLFPWDDGSLAPRHVSVMRPVYGAGLTDAKKKARSTQISIVHGNGPSGFSLRK
jgi:hypothetical protein